MKFNGFIMVNQKSTQNRSYRAYTTRFQKVLCYLKPGFRDQGGMRMSRRSIHQYVTEEHEWPNAVIGSLTQRELWCYMTK